LDAHPGFDPRNVHSLRLSLPATKYSTPDSIISFYQRVSERIRALPGVESVGTTYSLPMSTVAFAWEPLTIEGYVPKTAQDLIISNVRIVSPGYFAAMRIPLVRGRYFDERDTRGAPETAIVDEALAERYWPNEDPIGKRLQRGKSGAWRTVVGVISDAKEYSSENEPPIAVYYPAEQVTARSMYLVVRTTPDPAQMTSAITKEIQTVDPEMPVYDVSTMDERLSDSLARRRFSMLLLGVFAVIALVLAAIGISGVMAYSVSQRTHEIGVRMALGARSRDVLGLVVGQGIRLALAGTGIGLLAAVGLTRLMTKLLFGVSAADPATFVGVTVVLMSVALAACYVPARRATKVDPMVALRYE
jgi:predicted permease